MTTSARPIVVTLDRLTDLVAAVVHLLGFEPRDSVVGVALRPPRERLVFAARVDLPREPSHEAAVAAEVVRALRRAGARTALVLVFADRRPDDGGMPWQSLVDRVVAGATMPVLDAVLVAGDRLWSYLCDDPVCCPPEGQPRDPSSTGTVALDAAHALVGRRVMRDREAVVATVAPVRGVAAASMEQAIDRAAQRFAAVGADAFRDATLGVVRDAVDRYRRPPASLDHDDAAVLVVGLHDVRVRDELLRWCARDPDDAVRRMLGDLARLALPPLDAPACTTLGWSAYLQGDGVVAATAFERALTSDPEYSMARMLAGALRSQVPPTRLRRALRQR